MLALLGKAKNDCFGGFPNTLCYGFFLCNMGEAVNRNFGAVD